MREFQFTQPKRAATSEVYDISIRCTFQFTQPKRAATFGIYRVVGALIVSIHAAQAGCDKGKCITPSSSSLFQFTQPKRAATTYRTWMQHNKQVSIHAAQAGCDEELVKSLSTW